jgi:guanine deaminase
VNENPELLRAAVFHTPENAFHSDTALRSYPDGALAVSQGKILACGDYSDVRALFPRAGVRDLRGGFILPGFVDTHIHFPQVRIIGGLGHSLLDWLEQLTLPEEVRFADPVYAAAVADEFVHSLASHGTTTALVFGAHFVAATAALFDAASCAGLRVIGGLVLADRLLRPELHASPEQAWRDCQQLIKRVSGDTRLGYAVIPRFALSASEAMLEICQALLKEDASLRFTSHINESPREIEKVASLFPWARDYLDVYEKYNLIGNRSVLAHNLHASDSEIDRLAARGATVAHCPCSNAALGSGVFPMRRHLERHAHFAIGTDVGGGTGFGIMKEALQAHLLQRIAPNSVSKAMTITPAQMLYLATRAGAEALGMEAVIGDFDSGKSADFVVLQAAEKSPLAAVLKNAPGPEGTLAALFTLAGADSIREVRVEGELVYDCGGTE